MRRRAFLRNFGFAAAGAALGLGGARRAWGAVAPSDRVIVAHVGVGGMGNAHVGWFSSFEDVEVAALCDVDKGHLDGTLASLKAKRPNARIDAYGDFRKVLERDDIDVVTCATPDHWHALVATHAMLAGKDVYGEKPLSYSIPEGRAMLNALNAKRRIFQLGTQIHEGENYHRTVELIRGGVVGPVHTVRVWKTGGAPMIEKVPDSEPPKELDYDMWLGPRPQRPYNRQRSHFNFRYFWDYSGGMYADFWCHISDIAFWALNLGSPRTVAARGTLNTQGMAETHEWIDVDLEFENVKYFWTTNPPDLPGCGGRGIGACFIGPKGHLVVDYGSRQIFLDGKEVPGGDIADVPRSIPRSPGHQRNFIECVKSRKLPESNLPYAHNMTVPMHLGLIACKTGRKLTWDGQAERFVNDEEANALVRKTFRDPWSFQESLFAPSSVELKL